MNEQREINFRNIFLILSLGLCGILAGMSKSSGVYLQLPNLFPKVSPEMQSLTFSSVSSTMSVSGFVSVAPLLVMTIVVMVVVFYLFGFASMGGRMA